MEERLLSLRARYRESRRIAGLFSHESRPESMLNALADYFFEQVRFSRVLIVGTLSGKPLRCVRGFKEEESSEIMKISPEECRMAVGGVVAGFEATAEPVFCDRGIDPSRAIYGFSVFLATHAEDGQNRFLIMVGYDTAHRPPEGDDAELAESDIGWLTPVPVLFGQYLEHMRLSAALSAKAEENSRLAAAREAQVEARTRALLDALFDAKKFRLVVERADVIVALLDSGSRRFMFVNALWEQVTGYSRDEAVGRLTLDILDLIELERKPKLFSPEFDAIVKNEGAFRCTYVCTEKNGGERALSLSLSRFEDDAGGILYLVIGRDITEDRERSRRERTHVEEVERLNRLMINRELRIIELKRQLLSCSK